MSLVGYHPQNHPQQTRYAGSKRHVDDRALPQDLWQLLIQNRYALTIDAAAAAHNAKLPRYWTEEDNALEQSWAGERIYCNPPYSAIGPWVRKAWSETEAEIIVMLLPANRTEQTWWQEEIEPRRDRVGSPLRVDSSGRIPARPPPVLEAWTTDRRRERAPAFRVRALRLESFRERPSSGTAAAPGNP